LTSSDLFGTLFLPDSVRAAVADRAWIAAMLEFEAALAAAEARADVIPGDAVAAIAAACDAERFEPVVLARQARASGNPVVPLVRALTEAVEGDAARFVHWGATSQDVADSALVLTLRRARPILTADHLRLEATLRALSDRHARTVMLGRTLLQPAAPITFGLKAAHWVAALARGWARVDAAFDAALVLQFGGAAGTLAALGNRGLEVSQRLSEELDLANPGDSWHTDRDRLAALVSSCGIYTATLGKIATDIALLMQHEVGEVSEPGGESSAMPHKRNPAGCAVTIAAATRMPGLVAAFLTGMIQEHERAVGGWQAEWATIAAAVQSTGAAVAALADATGGLTIYPDRMRGNLEKTGGVIFAERAIMLSAAKAGKQAAQALVNAALARSRETGERFRDSLAALPEAGRMLSPEQLRTIDAPEEYLGAAEAIRRRLLADAS
jgi:3-carboxy-cis,cis-muconate cycloisomerase